MKVKMILFALALMISATASAQFVQNGGNSTRTVSSNGNASGYNRIYAAYAPLTISYDKRGADDTYLNYGIQVGWLGGRSIASSAPVYLEYGVNAHIAWDENVYDGTTTLVSLNVPVNITYRFALNNSNTKIAPYAGLRLKGNIIGTMSDDDGESYSLFDKKDVGEDTAKRVQFGYQVGVNFTFTNFHVGIGYAGDLSDFMKKTKLSGFVATIGREF